jgi:CRISPR-associated endonuclease/helicase Cas3
MLSKRAYDLVYRELKNNNVAIFVAPTSYGKTIFSPILLKWAKSDDYAYSLIHIAPYRALVKKIYEDKFKPYSSQFSVGYQSFDLIDPENKTPFFLREIVVTTIDSYVLNAFLIPVAEIDKILRELSKGHAFVTSTSIYTSINVFDEAHIIVSEGGNRAGIYDMVKGAITHLAKTNTPVLLETASIPSIELRSLIELMGPKASSVKIVYVCSNETCEKAPQISVLRNLGINVIEAGDPEWYSKNSYKWSTELVEEDNIAGKINEYCSSQPILVVRNTVRKAIETYKIAKDRCNKVVLIHGLMGSKDRTRVEAEIKNIVSSNGVIVATQVVEAGVDINARILITDIAPIENLAQRAGRLCRENVEECVSDGARVFILKPQDSDMNIYRRIYGDELDDTAKVLVENGESIRNIDWRLLEDYDGKISFTKFMEIAYSSRHGTLKNLIASKNAILTKILEYDTYGDDMLAILDRLGTLSSFGLFKIAPENDYENVVLIELEKLSSFIRKSREMEITCLDTTSIIDHEIRLKVYGELEDGSVRPLFDYSLKYEEYKRPTLNELKKFYKKLNEVTRKEKLRIIELFFKLKKECYSSELGAFYNVHNRE